MCAEASTIRYAHIYHTLITALQQSPQQCARYMPIRLVWTAIRCASRTVRELDYKNCTKLEQDLGESLARIKACAPPTWQALAKYLVCVVYMRDCYEHEVERFCQCMYAARVALRELTACHSVL